MSRNYIYIFLLIGVLAAAPGCKKYLEIQPVGAYTENQVFTSRSAVEQAMNGIYIKLAGNDLYGSALTQTYLELMAQQFRTFVAGVNFYEQYQRYDYDAPEARVTFQNIWKAAYSTILGANLFVEKIDLSVQANVISKEYGQLLKGEAIGIRALMHFDMLRLFGPVYSAGANQLAIPYYTNADAKVEPFITSVQVITELIDDLNSAETLLANDPVIQSGVVNNDDFYTGRRNQRMNYYAVKALKARVYLWAGKKAEARAAAKEVLTAVNKWFPWSPEEAIKDANYPDRIFSSEVLFAVYTREMYNNYAAYYAPTLLDSYLLTPQIGNLRATFDNNENDYRFSGTWKAIPGKSVRTFSKYENSSAFESWGFLQPMLRKSELYYILAETEEDPVQAIGYLNTVRQHRGLADLAGNALVPEEVLKEYKKEFYGEGQLFFYYKRTNTPALMDAVDASPRTPVYLVPLPLGETTPR